MRVWGTTNLKGGTGKTNLAVNLAVAGAVTGHKVCLLDADSLGDCVQWSERRGHDLDLVVRADRLQRLEQIMQEALRNGIDLLVVDTAGGASIEARSVAHLFDVLLVPVQATAHDLPRSVHTKQLIESTGVPCPFVLSRVQRENTERIRLFLERYSGFGTVAPFFIPERVGFADAFAAGQGIIEYAPDHPGSQAITSLFDHLMREYLERNQHG